MMKLVIAALLVLAQPGLGRLTPMTAQNRKSLQQVPWSRWTRATSKPSCPTWAEDGVLEWVNGVEVGKAAIRKAMSGFGGARKVDIPEGATSRARTRHQIINHVIDVTGNTAKTTAYWFALTNTRRRRMCSCCISGTTRMTWYG